MHLHKLSDLPIEDWPSNAPDLLHMALQDPDNDLTLRVMAAEMAGNLSVLDDDLAQALLGILRDAAQPEALRGTAAIALGPILEDLDMGFYDNTPETPPVSAETAQEIRATLRFLHEDPRTPKTVRRRVLEGSIRAPEDWHPGAVREAWASQDPDWRLTAVFCMGYLPGFRDEVLEALESEDPRIRFEAVQAAGQLELEEAFPAIHAILTDPQADLDLLFAAIDAVPSVRPDLTMEVLGPFLESEDEELTDAAHAAIEYAAVLEEEPER